MLSNHNHDTKKVHNTKVESTKQTKTSKETEIVHNNLCHFEKRKTNEKTTTIIRYFAKRKTKWVTTTRTKSTFCKEKDKWKKPQLELVIDNRPPMVSLSECTKVFQRGQMKASTKNHLVLVFDNLTSCGSGTLYCWGTFGEVFGRFLGVEVGNGLAATSICVSQT